MTRDVRTSTAKAQAIALVVGLVSLAAWAAVAVPSPARAMPPYLVGVAFWTGISLGCLSLVMLHQLVGGGWGVPVRRPMEAGATALPLLAILFVPIALSLPSLYPWADPSAFVHYEHLARKTKYLNPGAFVLRSTGYFVIWSVLALLMVRWSRTRDSVEAPGGPSARMSTLSGPGLGIIFGTATLAAIDWMMSREPDWTSTIYGPMVIIGWGLATLALMIVVASLMARSGGPLADSLTPDRLNDLGNLLLAFVMLWAYMSFSQYLIIWSGNLAEEIPWYLRRTSGPYQWVAPALIAFHFAVPFFLLMFRETKRRKEAIVFIAAGIALMHVLDLAWLILPASPDPKVGRFMMTDAPLVVASVVGIGGLWTALALRVLDSAPIVMPRDPITGEIAEPPHGGQHA